MKSQLSSMIKFVTWLVSIVFLLGITIPIVFFIFANENQVDVTFLAKSYQSSFSSGKIAQIEFNKVELSLPSVGQLKLRFSEVSWEDGKNNIPAFGVNLPISAILTRSNEVASLEIYRANLSLTLDQEGHIEMQGISLDEDIDVVQSKEDILGNLLNVLGQNSDDRGERKKRSQFLNSAGLLDLPKLLAFIDDIPVQTFRMSGANISLGLKGSAEKNFLKAKDATIEFKKAEGEGGKGKVGNSISIFTDLTDGDKKIARIALIGRKDKSSNRQQIKFKLSNLNNALLKKQYDILRGYFKQSGSISSPHVVDLMDPSIPAVILSRLLSFDFDLQLQEDSLAAEFNASAELHTVPDQENATISFSGLAELSDIYSFKGNYQFENIELSLFNTILFDKSSSTDSPLKLNGFLSNLSGDYTINLNRDIRMKSAMIKLNFLQDQANKEHPVELQISNLNKTFPIGLEDVQSVIHLANDQDLIIDNKIKLSIGDSQIDSNIKLGFGWQDDQSDFNLRLIDAVGKMTGNPFALQESLSYCPIEASPKLCQWLQENIHEGNLKQVTFSIKKTEEQPSILNDEFKVLMDVNQVDMTFLDQVLPLKNGSGQIAFFHDHVDIQLDQGEIAPADGAKVSVANSQLTITDIHDIGYLAGDVGLSANFSGLIGSINMSKSAFDIKRRFPFDLSEIKGDLDAKINFAFPLEEKQILDEIKFQIEGQGKGLRLNNQESIFNNGQVQITANRDMISISGGGDFFNYPGDFKWQDHSVLETKKKNGQNLEFNFKHDEKTRAILGGNIRDFWTGLASSKLKIKTEGNNISFSIDTDVTNSRMNLVSFDYEKPENVEGQIIMKVANVKQGKALVNQLDITFGNIGRSQFMLKSRGVVDITGKWLDRFKVDHLYIDGGRIDLSSDIQWQEDKSIYKVDIEGNSFDLQPILKYFNQNTVEIISESSEKLNLLDSIPPIDLSGRMKNLHLYKQKGIDNFIFTFKSNPQKGIEQLTISGQSNDIDENGEKPGLFLSFGKANLPQSETETEGETRAEEDEAQLLKIRSSNAGNILSILNISSGNVIGGRLTVDARREKGSEFFIGDFILEKFQVKGTPIILRLLNAISIQGALDTAVGKPTSFTRLNGRFQYANNSLTLQNSLALSAGGVGLSFTGTINGKNDDTAVDINGKAVPAYQFNRFIDNIPLLGRFLTGGKGDGLLAGEFTIEGKLNDPQLTFNPVATITPGFIRNFFR